MKHALLIVMSWFLTVGATTAFGLGAVTVSGSIPRGNAVTSFPVTISVKDAKQPTAAENADLLRSRVRFFVNEISSSDWIRGENEPIESATVDDYFISSTSTPESTLNTNNLYDITFSATVNTRGGVTFNEKYKNKTLTVFVRYSETGFEPAEGTKSAEVALVVSVQVAVDAPTGLNVAGAREAIAVTYAGSSTTTFSNGQSGTATSAVMVVIDDTSSVRDLPAMLFVDDPAAEGDTEAPAGTCTFTPDYTSGNSCVTCSDDKAYLDTEQLKAMEGSGLYARSVTPTKGNLELTGLTIGRSYSIFMYYEPGGLNQSACYHAVPYSGCDYAECLGEESKHDTPRCFIATAAYGSPLHKNLKLFTWFRGNVLLKTDLGRDFVHWYYKNGPAAAQVVAAHPALAFGVRAVLWIPALLIGFWLALMQHDPLAYGVIVALVTFGIAVVRRRRIQEALRF